MKSAWLACGLLLLLLPCGQAQAGAGEELLDAAADGDEAAVRSLLARGADVGATDGKARTALHLAAEGGHEEVVILLLRNGADVQATDTKGRTPLHLAASAGEGEVLVLLVDAGGSMETADRAGRTPQSLASKVPEMPALLDWHDARKADKYQVYKTFLEEHPDSRYAGEARTRAAALYDRECTSKTRTRQVGTRQVVEYLTPSGKPCGKREMPTGPEAAGRPAPAKVAPRPAKPGVDVPPAGGVMVIEETLYDGGEIERGRKLEHTFIVKNTGTGPLTIKAKPG